MGMAGFARSGGARGTAGIQKVNTGSVLKASVARGDKSVSGEGKDAAAARSGDDLPRVDPPKRVPVLEPPVHVDLACTRPSAERKVAVDMSPTDISLGPDAKPVSKLPAGEPTVPQDRPRDVV